MGKRKERRLAAKTAVNRRVKLDLMAEPSGDFGDSSNKEDVEGGGNSKNHAGSPDSPSSSGQKPENPLLLLGQYSDEELEEESGKEISHDTRENSPAELDEQVKAESHEGTEVDKDENITCEKPDQENKEHSSSLDVEENGVVEDDIVLPSHKDMDEVEQTTMSWTSDTQTENMDSGWKMVLHEESNSYYYWNIATGQTSWEVPVDLVQGNEPAYDPQSVTEVEEMNVTSDDTQPNDGPTKPLVFEATDKDSCRPELQVQTENHTDIMTMSNDVVEGNYVNTIDGVNNGEAHHTDSLRLLQLGESLSERLKSLKGENNEISKLMIELDVRLADIKSLVPYGSSLLPFWLHSENHLRKLESAINNEIQEHSQSPNEAEKKVEENMNEATASEKEEKENENAVPQADTDDDMDVEMEVEDEPVVQNRPQSEEESEVPPPPNDEWVPPPPPDDEPLPPPPPDEQPEATFPPPQAYSYGGEGEEYAHFAYGGPAFEYYGQQVVANHDYFVDANGAPLTALYYGTSVVGNPPYPGGTSVVDPGEHVTYYTIQEGSVPIQPVIGSESVAATCTVSAPTESSSVPKVQPKVVRNKKRTVAAVPGLRSNKKVSGLVDKWKAVKEELHEEDEEDEEPENALEALEKKKQREIEQWRAQQIATGEAKDNANFQPLGGDWRERVRRKRAKKSMEAEDKEAKGTVDTTNQKPDLVQLTKQLPSPWQAYWDEASKQVYYGNSKTSETSWTKPQP
ncbi:uncharacterized protein LOC111876068 isoform X1 [Lactuca sativa]|uniref:uncharacterized protein LOC111876068 isoform X1 n=1 Tax=Lactuca sativa TaxID=4236 RepID=UPI000CD9BE3B|nr:uncharacterized protein LOC111876068 isoform X1 [Lactuca sativa]